MRSRSTPAPGSRYSLHVAAGFLVACTGTIGSGPAPDDAERTARAKDEPGGTSRDRGIAAPRTVGASATLRLLTRDEYSNSVRDLLGDDSRPGDRLPGDQIFLGLGLAGNMSELRVETLSDAALDVAGRAGSRLDSILSCDPGVVGEAACAHQFIARLARRAFRRPVGDDELERLNALYDTSRPIDGFVDAVTLVVQAILQSPRFLYVAEIGVPSQRDEETGAVPLTDHELASRLGYFLWTSLPDPELDALADAGSLSDERELERQVRRMLMDERASGTLHSLHRDWLGLGKLETIDKNPALYPQFTAGLRAAMAEETRRFVADAIQNEGTLRALFTAPATWLNDQAAATYGMGKMDRDWKRVDLDADQRAGLLTQPSLLAITAHADHTSPVLRGQFVRESLLCVTLPPPPPGVEVELAGTPGDLPARERFEQHSTDASCSGCHSLMDPIGFGFENYDPVGRFRTEEAGRPIDASGVVTNSDDLDGPFTGAVELAHRLAESHQVADCVARRWFRYALKRGEDDDASSLNAAVDRFVASSGAFEELLAGLVTTDAFRQRKDNP